MSDRRQVNAVCQLNQSGDNTKMIIYSLREETLMATPDIDPAGGLLKPLQKTQAVTDDLQSASNDALVIGAVLAKELPAHVQMGDVAQVIEHTEELKDKLEESAETLTEVSAELEHEIEKRRAVARQLAASRAQVEHLEAEISDSHKSES